jgi:DNA-binding NtrC family response regulator
VASKLLIIEPEVGSAVPIHLQLPAPTQRTTWSEFADAKLDMTRMQLILAGASREVPYSLSFLAGLCTAPFAVPVVAVLPSISDADLLRTAAEAADDFLLCPVHGEELNLRIRKLLGDADPRRARTCRALVNESVLAQLIGEHPVFLDALNQIERFRFSDAPVLITGETGTGKELFAHAIHSLSHRHDGPFIPVDCATLPEHIAESELFGHRRGAFTDAHADQKGLAAMAEGGTLFLDEIDALSLGNQAKLLRFLQEGSYRALGADRFTRANVRVIAATNLRIEEHMRTGSFRSDLYFRINVLRLQLTPLRERRGDISLLARYFLENDCGGESGRKVFTPAAFRKLDAHHWPGNIRELCNTVQRAYLRSTGRWILPTDIEIDSDYTQQVTGHQHEGNTLRFAKRQVVESFERSFIEELLTKHGGNVTHAAAEAGKDRRAFGRLAKKYRLL